MTQADKYKYKKIAGRVIISYDMISETLSRLLKSKIFGKYQVGSHSI